jgi:P27 family predicted phage terminase small subunit
MGARGPLKLVDLTVPYQAQTPEAPAATIPKPPKWLTALAKREWRRLAPGLVQRGLLTDMDRQAFAQYCSAVAAIEEAEEALKNGKTYETPGGRQFLKPEYRILQDAVKEVRAHCMLFGLSPSARMRMELPEPKQVDELESLLD